MLTSRTAVSLAVSLLLCGGALAAEPAVVVTATRMDVHSSTTPGHITVIDSDAIQRSPAATLPELLSLEAGVFSRSLFGNNAASSTLDVRGFGAASSQNTLVLLDGRRLNDVDMSAVDFSAIPLRSIERIEITRNGGAVLYGDGAVGGTINIVTRDAYGADTGGNAELKLGSYNTRELNGDYLARIGQASLRLDAQAINSDGYRDNNELQQRNLRADLRVTNEDIQWYAKAGADDQQLGLPGPRLVDPGLGIDQLASDRDGTDEPNNYADQNGQFLTLGVSRITADNSEWILDLGYRRKHQESFFDYGIFGSSYLEADLDTWSLTPRLNTRFGPVHSTLGMDLYYADYNTDESLDPTTIGTPYGQTEVTQETRALYTQNHLNVGDATRLDFGARLQWVKFEGEDRVDNTAPGSFGATTAPDFDRSDRVHMLELGLHHQLNEDVALFAKASRSARFATVDDVFESKFDFITMNTARVFSPLNPQTGTGLDLGTEYSRGGTRATATAYYMELKNEIHFDPVAYDNINLDPTRRYGLELSVQHALSDTLTVRGNYTYTRARFRDGAFDGNEVPLVPEHSASLTADWAVRADTRLAATARYIGDKYFDNDQTNDFGSKIPDYTMVDVKLSHELQDWSASLTVHNLFDEKAFDYGARSTISAGRYNAYPLPERNFMMSLARSF